MIRRLVFATILLAATSAWAGTGRVVIVNVDSPGTGFNDPTPATPVGGNPGTTLGQQRLNVFRQAAERWRYALDTNVDILVRATFAPIPGGCTDDGRAVLGFASAVSWTANFPGAPREDVWYPAALVNKFAGSDLFPGSDDIEIQFNADVDRPTCLGELDWYYGFDGKKGEDVLLYSVVLHEIAHGLGISGVGYPDFSQGRPAVFDTHTLDLEAGLRWSQMTRQQRQTSMTNTGQLVWDGENVKKAIAQYLIPMTTLTVTAPSPIARNYDIGTAAFGPRVDRTPMTGTVVQAADGGNVEGPSTTDGCTAFTNAGAIAGQIALIDRGTCTFVQKATNAQAAGAIGLIVADNRRDTCLPPGMAGDAPEITIPVLSITMDDGLAVKGQLASTPVNAMLRVDPSQLAGTSPEGYVRLYAPCTLERGSSIYHFDVVATPNLLMEPFINDDLLNSLDLTVHQLIDIGWSLPPRTGRRFVRR